MVDPRRIRLIRFGPLGCAVMLAVALAMAWVLRKLIFFAVALVAVLVFGWFAYRAGWSALGLRREICPGCGGRMTVKFEAESTRCPRCGMIHVFRAIEREES